MDSFASRRDQDAFAQNGLNPNDGQADGSITTSWDRCSAFGLMPAGKPVYAVTSNIEFYKIIK